MAGGNVMSWDEEWAALKQTAAGDSGMQLASAGGDGWQGGSGDGSASESDALKSKKAAWVRAGHDVQSLRGDVKKALTKLEDGQQGFGTGSGVSGVHSAAAQQEVFHSWQRYLESLSGRCSALQVQLEKAGDHLDGNDQAVRRSFNKLSDRYEDTPAVGGRGGGK